ncbi:MAG TPA: DUF2520 domain-containing protein [Candidatus Limnocylindrales bacterium]|nr:DUF2520 domain-containing protein [Candidatus Limnocylindrales bacterium]
MKDQPHHDQPHGDHGPPGHRHPHGPDRAHDPEALPRLGFVGAGRVALTLGPAFAAAGWPVVAVASRDPERRMRFQSLVPGAHGFAEPAGILDDVDIAFLTVPDDAIAPVAGSMRLYSGQGIVHTSGLLPAAVLSPAMAAGTLAGSFHPLVAFAEPDTARAALRGATVAIEGDEALVSVLAELAEAVGAQPVRLPSGGKAAYHAAAVLAAGGFVALLDAIAEVGRGAGLDEAGALAVYGPLVRQSLANAERLGIRAALTGPIVRGDRGTLRAHMDALRALAPGALGLYAAAARREIALAEERGDLPAADAEALRALLTGSA